MGHHNLDKEKVFPRYLLAILWFVWTANFAAISWTLFDWCWWYYTCETVFQSAEEVWHYKLNMDMDDLSFKACTSSALVFRTIVATNSSVKTVQRMGMYRLWHKHKCFYQDCPWNRTTDVELEDELTDHLSVRTASSGSESDLELSSMSCSCSEKTVRKVIPSL